MVLLVAEDFDRDRVFPAGFFRDGPAEILVGRWI
jgi:hypothetical protein